MPGVILENLSGRKLSFLVSVLAVLLVACFLIGGIVAPAPTNASSFSMIKCIDDDQHKWYYTRGVGRCEFLEYSGSEKLQEMSKKVVFAVQIPFPRDNEILDYSRWQQNLIGVLMFEIIYDKLVEMPKNVPLTMDVRLGYRNQGDYDDDWKPYAEAVVERSLDCDLDTDLKAYNCSFVPLFELGSLHHDFYLLNVRFPTNANLGHLTDVWLVGIHQNGGFTKVWWTLKSAFFPLVIVATCWFWSRVRRQNRQPVLLEYMLLSVGGALTFLNAPVELLTLYLDLPIMPLFQDIRQGVFYASLLSFWLVFAGEHLMMNDPQPHQLRIYWKHLSAVLVGCVSLLVFDVFEKGSQASNPFYSVWVTPLGASMALTFIICAGISAAVYFVFLCYMIWKVFANISSKRSMLPTMSRVRRLHYEGIIYRFRFLMLATLTCAATTVVGFIVDQMSEGRWKWDEHLELEYTSAFLTGTYGMWNIYILALIVLYTPSHKQWPSDVDVNSPVAGGIELSLISANEPSEASLLTSFAKKVAHD